MAPIEIQFEIRRRGWTQRQLAKELGYDEMSISRCIHKKNMSAKLIWLICGKIGCDPKKAFPEYFRSRERKPRQQKAA